MAVWLRSSLILIAVTGSAWAQPLGDQLDRRDRREPAIVLQTGGRTGTCDVLKFTADGSRLLAVGDDKMVTEYPVTEAGLNSRDVRFLYWPAWREQRGAIYALALSPDDRRVAIGGLGVKTSSVAVLDRASGEILSLATVERGRENYFAVMSLAFSPSGSRLAIGTGSGHVAVWDFQAPPVVLDKHEPIPNTPYNRVRAVRFDGEDRIVSVAESAEVRSWQRMNAGWSSAVIVKLKTESPLRAVAFSSDGSWFAAGELNRFVHVVPSTGRESRKIEWGADEFPRCLTFAPDGRTLAVGVGRLKRGERFPVEGDESVKLVDLAPVELSIRNSLPHRGRVEALAWHGNRIGVAGGDNHEVTLWDVHQRDKPLSVARGGGAGLWGVALSHDGRFLAFADQRNPQATHPNRRATDDYRYFDLSRRRLEKNKPEQTLFTEPLEQAAGWTLIADDKLPWQWHAVDAANRRYPLPWDRDTDGRPTCFTFLRPNAGQPVRVAVGHYWGFSLFELSGAGARRTHLFTGHHGEVTAITASRDGTWLVTASNDQTLAAWSVPPWPVRSPLGATFTALRDAVRVDTVEAGGPAWEMGLSPGDEIVLVAAGAKEVFVNGKLGTPSQAKTALDTAEPGREIFVTSRRLGREKPFSSPSFLRTRPLWRMLPGSDREWILWMWQGSFYDCSTHGDSLAGWLMNDPSLTKSPRVYLLEQFRDQFNRPDVIEELIARRNLNLALQAALGDNPVAINLGLNEPADVRIEAPAETPGPVNIRLTAAPRGDNVDMQPHRVELWINDFRAMTWEPNGQAFDQIIKLDPKLLRAGENRLTLQSFNRLGGRSDATRSIHNPRQEESRKLHGLGVAVNDYSGTTASSGKRGALGNLTGAISDVERQAERWSTQKGKLYDDLTFILKPDREVTREKVLAQLDHLAQVSRPDDRLVLFLSGHGDFQKIPAPRPKKPITSFYFCCFDFDQRRPGETGIDHATLYERLARIPCRKVVFLDACHSGEAAFNPVRQLTPAGQGPIILAACDRAEFAYEHPTKKNGLFTLAILHALDDGFVDADRNRDGTLDARELIDAVRRRMPALLIEAGKADDLQNPQCFPQRPESFPLYRR